MGSSPAGGISRSRSVPSCGGEHVAFVLTSVRSRSSSGSEAGPRHVGQGHRRRVEKIAEAPRVGVLRDVPLYGFAARCARSAQSGPERSDGGRSKPCKRSRGGRRAKGSPRIRGRRMAAHGGPPSTMPDCMRPYWGRGGSRSQEQGDRSPTRILRWSASFPQFLRECYEVGDERVTLSVNGSPGQWPNSRGESRGGGFAAVAPSQVLLASGIRESGVTDVVRQGGRRSSTNRGLGRPHGVAVSTPALSRPVAGVRLSLGVAQLTLRVSPPSTSRLVPVM